MTTKRSITLAARRLAMLCAGGLLLACSAPPLGQSAGPPMALQAGAADGYYALGRQHYAARRYDDALAAYQRALALAPLHVDARNGMAAVHAARGELAAAIAIWRSLTDERQPGAGRDAAFLFNNLGYAYLLAGDAAQARVALERACLLDPLDDRAWENLGQALARQGEHERAQQMAQQAATLRRHDLKADYAALAGAPAWTGAEVHLGGRSGPAGPLPAGAAGQASPPLLPFMLPAAGGPAPGAAPAGSLPLLEISNGNGVKGMAAALGRSVNRGELQLARLSNQRGFAVQRTRIEYRDGHGAAARRLAARLRPAPLLQQARVDGVAIRLVIGHDLVQGGALPRLAMGR